MSHHTDSASDSQPFHEVQCDHVVPVVAGVGTGSNELSAYDDVLYRIGVGNLNIITLSSVLPPGWVPRVQQTLENETVWGNRLFVVQARAVSRTPGATVAAGIGWVLFEHGGILVEHEAVVSTTGAATIVERDIAESISDVRRRRGMVPIGAGNLVVSAQVDGPTCVAVLAVFQEVPWLCPGLER